MKAVRTKIVGRPPALPLLVPMLLLTIVPSAGLSERKASTVPVPEERVPVGPLGYWPPGSLYKLSNRSYTALHFADDHHLLFSFRQPRLLRREQKWKDEEGGHTIRAVVIELPSGDVSASAEWRMYDHSRYLWPLPGGKFLIRRGNTYFIADERLKLEEFLTVPTAVHATEVSPDGSTLVIEHEYEQHTPEEHRRLVAQAEKYGEPPPQEGTQISVVDLRTRKAIAAFRVKSPVTIPISRQGYVGVSAAKEDEFTVKFVPFEGAPEALGQVASVCPPRETFLNREAIMIESCGPKNSNAFLDVWTIDGKKLWSAQREAHFVWPTFAFSFGASRFAVGLLHVSHTIEANDSLEDDDVREQVIKVFDTQTGALLLTTTASPVLAAGQNFALSAQGDRLAVLHEGAIEIYKVPAGAPPA